MFFLVMMMFLAALSFLGGVDIFGQGGDMVLAASAVIGGPLRELKWSGLTLHPSKDGEAEIKFSGDEYEASRAADGNVYSIPSSVVGQVKQECVMSISEYQDFIKKRDGEPRSGTATMASGDVLSLNCLIDGEHNLSGGKVEVTLSGEVKLQ